MQLELDHFFILTDQPEQAGDRLVDFGLQESFRRDHKGQGTSNRCFVFANGMLELLYLRDAMEANQGPAKSMHLVERLARPDASPFGVVLTRTCEMAIPMPFQGWSYQPDYFPVPNAFHVGANSAILAEPLCVYVPFMSQVKRYKKVKRDKGEAPLGTISKVTMAVANEAFSDTLKDLSSVDRLAFVKAEEHLVELTLGNEEGDEWQDFRPHLPLIIRC
ncbi:VOC family protein [Marinomonas sp. THO17]|uniref:VOC family protein n=1 Tax=Marinomonas sp. THO17 TaxID=3149048 RepID=UPI00336C1109